MEASEEDRLSYLDSSILHRIFSLVDMKHAVQCSVLSSRWRYFWTTLPTLNISYRKFSDLIKKKMDWKEGPFVEFVDQVFLLHRVSSIQRFHLCYDMGFDILSDHFSSWIRGLIRRNVQELELDINIPFNSTNKKHFPFCLFTCESLVVLKLKFGHLRYTLALPNKIFLPTLKTLHLQGVRFKDDNLTINFLSSCPVLESLIIMDSELAELNNLVISGSELKHLVIETYSFDGERDEPVYCKIKICAPKLVSFRCKDYMGKDYSFENLPTLVNVDIDMEVESLYRYHRVEFPAEEYVQRMIRYLRELCHVKSLTLAAWFLQIVSTPPAALESLSMQFLNLRYIKLNTWLSRDCIHAIICLLNMSPNVETLAVEVNKKCTFAWRHIYSHYGEEMPMLNSDKIGEYQDTGLALQTMHHLKVIEIQGVLESINGLKLLEILLKNAVVLRKIRVLTPKENLPGRERRLMKHSDEILELPRASSSIAFLFF